ncbi:MAG: hypothetical protein M5R42_12635 [Rhodocyclaceae bacterium]|nr:hypothetical protein [Rhodocyclaceae bacterium]
MFVERQYPTHLLDRFVEQLGDLSTPVSRAPGSAFEAPHRAQH